MVDLKDKAEGLVDDAKDAGQDVLDKVEKDYIDPLKAGVDKYSKKPLKLADKYGKYVPLVFVAVGFLAIGIYLVVHYL